jgi:hypothetical protein
MPADQSQSEQPPITATTTITAVTTFASESVPPSEQPPSQPKWGDLLESIPPARQDELRALYEQQVEWAKQGQPDPVHSPFSEATRGDDPHPLNGAEVFFLVADALARQESITPREAAARLRAIKRDYPDTWVELHFRLHLEGAELHHANLAGAELHHANLAGANLWRARLEGANLIAAHLEGAYLGAVHLEGADITRAHLEGANLRGVTFSTATDLEGAVVFDNDKILGMPGVTDVRWHDVILAVVNWPERPILGDERVARELEKQGLNVPKEASRGERQKAEADRDAAILEAWRAATRAYRQLASVMRDQGMNDEADRFAYKGQVCQRALYRVQRQRVRRTFSHFLDVLAGYGFHPGRSLVWYLVVIFGFAFAYFHLGPSENVPFSPLGSVVFSVTSFHGRGFFPGGSPGHSLTLDDPVTVLAAGEAIIGLLIEISFIATFTQRFFSGK